MRDRMIGPALGGAQQRWKDNDATIFEFIRNSQVVIDGGDEYAKGLFEKWGPTEMPSFFNLTDDEIESILNYIDEAYTL